MNAFLFTVALLWVIVMINLAVVLLGIFAIIRYIVRTFTESREDQS